MTKTLSNLLLIISMLLTAFVLKAQTTLSGADLNPIAGETFFLKQFDTSYTVGGSGANQIWDFSNLQTNGQIDTLEIGSATSFGANTSLCYPSACWSFLNNNAAGMEIKLSSGLGVNYQNGDGEVILAYPLLYGAHYTDIYQGSLISSSGERVGSNEITVDGEGALILPGGIVFDSVVRVHLTKTYTDNYFGGGGIGPSHADYIEEYYLWYKAGYHTELLQMALNLYDTSTVSYYGKYLDDKSLSIIEMESNIGINVLENPFNSTLKLNVISNRNQSISIRLVDVLGKEQLNHAEIQVMKGINEVKLSMAQLPAATYFLVIESDNFKTSKIVIKQ